RGRARVVHLLERLSEETDVRGAELRHARQHVGSHGSSAHEHFLEPFALELSADTVERRRHASFDAHRLAMRALEPDAQVSARTAAPAALVTGIAVVGCKRALDALRLGQRRLARLELGERIAYRASQG